MTGESIVACFLGRADEPDDDGELECELALALGVGITLPTPGRSCDLISFWGRLLDPHGLAMALARLLKECVCNVWAMDDGQ